MKCVYKFPIQWVVQIDGVRAFMHEGWQYDFVSEQGRLTHLQVTIPVSDNDHLPELVQNPQDPSALDLRLNSPSCSDLLFKSLRTLEGFLAVYGLERIALDETEMTWIPECDEDRKRLKTTNFSFKFKKPKNQNLRAPFSVVTRSIIASKDALDWDMPLGFFRKGRNDFLERRYIDAIYDFYFVLETLFGNGKTKNVHVATEFKQSTELVNFAADVLKNAEMSILRRGGRKNLIDTFRAKYAGKSPEEFLDSIVLLRGFLHHHTVRNKKIWDPAQEYEYEVDALLLSNLCFKACCKKVESLVCSPLN